MTETAPSGLSDNGAGRSGLRVTIIPAIIFLMMPPYNQSSYVRLPRLAVHLPERVAGFALWIVIAIFATILSRLLRPDVVHRHDGPACSSSSRLYPWVWLIVRDEGPERRKVRACRLLEPLPGQ